MKSSESQIQKDRESSRRIGASAFVLSRPGCFSSLGLWWAFGQAFSELPFFFPHLLLVKIFHMHFNWTKQVHPDLIYILVVPSGLIPKIQKNATWELALRILPSAGSGQPTSQWNLLALVSFLQVLFQGETGVQLWTRKLVKTWTRQRKHGGMV